MERKIDQIETRNKESVEKSEKQISDGLKARQQTLPLIKKTAKMVKVFDFGPYN